MKTHFYGFERLEPSFLPVFKAENSRIYGKTMNKMLLGLMGGELMKFRNYYTRTDTWVS